MRRLFALLLGSLIESAGKNSGIEIRIRQVCAQMDEATSASGGEKFAERMIAVGAGRRGGMGGMH
jgi:hypothetical protein